MIDAGLTLETVTISGLPLSLHEGKLLSLKSINYLFGANGSGKTLVLKKIAQAAKAEVIKKKMNQVGYFIKCINVTHGGELYEDSFPILNGKASTYDLQQEGVTGQILYQQLEEFPEIKIRIRDSLQKYLGRYPNMARRNVTHAMTFLRNEEGIDAYSPRSESDGLRRLTLLLAYIYHPKCVFLAIDEPELHLHPDMISFLLEEMLTEVTQGKQFVLATHSPEMIQIGRKDIYGYYYFNLKDKLRDSHIIQASEVMADSIMENLGHLLDANRRAFLYAPITVFVEGPNDEAVYMKLKNEQKVKWGRRVFMVNVGGVGNMFNFWLLWRKFAKDCRVILDSPKDGEQERFKKLLGKFSKELSIDSTLTPEQRRDKLEKNGIFITPFVDVLHFGPKNIKTKDLNSEFHTLDLSVHIKVLHKAIVGDEPKIERLRKEEKEWLELIAGKVFREFLSGNDESSNNAIEELRKEYPGLIIDKLENDPKYLLDVKFTVSKTRQLYLRFGKSVNDMKIGVRKEAG